MQPIFRKYNYIKVFKFTEKKTLTVTYHKISNFNPNFLINPDHIFNHGGFQTIITTESSAETLNPLDFESKFNQKDFKVAIESKLVKDAFGSLQTNKIDWMKVILFANLMISATLLYLLLKQTGAI